MTGVDAIEGHLRRVLDLRSNQPVLERAIVIEHREPLADDLTTMPAWPEHPGRTAGATFDLFYQPDYLLPHRRAAWLLMAEHLGDAAVLADAEAERDPRFMPVLAALRSHADVLHTNAA